MNMAFEIEKLLFFYEERRVIDDLTIDIEAGKFYGIIGPNGCGKTTLIDLITKHKKPVSGNISYKGKDLSLYSKKELSMEIALVPQNFYINFPFTVEEIVMMGRYPYIPRFSAPSPEDYKIVYDIMKKTGIYKFKDRFITELSSGERQRIVFARALVQDTPVLILDEATSNLDVNYSLTLLNIAAQRVNEKKRTVIAVLQDINLAAIYCDYLLFIKQGSIAAHGNTDEILNRDTLQSVFNVDAKVYFEPYSDSMQVVFKK